MSSNFLLIFYNQIYKAFYSKYWSPGMMSFNRLKYWDSDYNKQNETLTGTINKEYFSEIEILSIV